MISCFQFSKKARGARNLHSFSLPRLPLRNCRAPFDKSQFHARPSSEHKAYFAVLAVLFQPTACQKASPESLETRRDILKRLKKELHIPDTVSDAVQSALKSDTPQQWQRSLAALQTKVKAKLPEHAPLMLGNLELCPGADVDVKDHQNNWLPGKINGLQGSTVRERDPRHRLWPPLACCRSFAPSAVLLSFSLSVLTFIRPQILLLVTFVTLVLPSQLTASSPLLFEAFGSCPCPLHPLQRLGQQVGRVGGRVAGAYRPQGNIHLQGGVGQAQAQREAEVVISASTVTACVLCGAALSGPRAPPPPPL
ncbi:unnamed protein product [Scytosiphon promiscuus]